MQFENKLKKPSKLLLVISIVIFILSIVLFAFLLINNIRNMTGKSDGTITVEAPGVCNVELEEGKYTILLQTSGSRNGEYFSINKNISGLKCQIYNDSNNVDVTSTKINTTVSSGNESYVGIFDFTIDKTGKYTIETKLDDIQFNKVYLRVQNSTSFLKAFGSISLCIIILFIGIASMIVGVLCYIIKYVKYKKELNEQLRF